MSGRGWRFVEVMYAANLPIVTMGSVTVSAVHRGPVSGEMHESL
jgi:hypothetical protein